MPRVNYRVAPHGTAYVPALVTYCDSVRIENRDTGTVFSLNCPCPILFYYLLTTYPLPPLLRACAAAVEEVDSLAAQWPLRPTQKGLRGTTRLPTTVMRYAHNACSPSAPWSASSQSQTDLRMHALHICATKYMSHCLSVRHCSPTVCFLA